MRIPPHMFKHLWLQSCFRTVNTRESFINYKVWRMSFYICALWKHTIVHRCQYRHRFHRSRAGGRRATQERGSAEVSCTRAGHPHLVMEVPSGEGMDGEPQLANGAFVNAIRALSEG